MHARRGTALLIALALLALGAALLAGSAEAGRSAVRSVQSYEAALLADAESRVVVAEFMAAWSPVADSLAMGAGMVSTIGPRHPTGSTMTAVSRLRLQRVTVARFVLGVECQVGPDNAVLARRRLQVFLERPSRSDSLGPILPPVPLKRWSFADLF
ncbi:MAG: hypothetical protein ABI625_05095 [bacterium]